LTNQPVGIPFQNPTDYIGPKMDIVPIKRFPREPLTTDKKYRVGQLAILGKNPSTGNEGELFYLARFESNGDATWVQFDSGTSGIGIESLQTDDGAPPVVPDITGVVGVLGGIGITTSGQDPETDVTIDIDNSVVGQTITGDDSNALSPTLGNWNILGGIGIDTSGSGSDLTIDMDGSIVTSQYDADSGTATPTAGVLNIIGGNGTVTSATGNTVTIEMDSPFVGDFSFESNTGGEIETLTVQNTVDAADSGSMIQSLVAGSDSTGNPVIQVASTGQRAVGFDIDTSTGNPRFMRSIDGSTILSEMIFSIFGTDDNARLDLMAPGGTFITRTNSSGNTATLNILNASSETGSDARILIQSADPTVGDGGGNQYIIWGAENQVQFSLGQGRDATPSTQPLEFKSNGFPSGDNIMQLHPGAGGNITLNKVGALTLHTGTTAERPATPINGMIRYNTTIEKFEGFEDGAWVNLI